jgi:hypothetical protein
MTDRSPTASATPIVAGVQFTADSHDDVAAGRVTLTVRLWSRPQVKQGGRYNVGPVEIEVDDIELVPFGALTDDDLVRTGMTDREAVRTRAAHAGPIADDTLVYRIEFHVVGKRRNPADRPADAKTVAEVIAKLDAMDARSPHGAWTRPTLRLIGNHPGTVSTDLAATMHRSRPEFKVDVRKLKALGLTESLEVGYRLTKLGRAVVKRSD